MKTLGHKSTHSTLKINGIGGKVHTANARINVMLKSNYGDFSSRLEAMALPNIVNDQPTRNICRDSWKESQNITLADPLFGKPGKIEVLL